MNTIQIPDDDADYAIFISKAEAKVISEGLFLYIKKLRKHTDRMMSPDLEMATDLYRGLEVRSAKVELPRPTEQYTIQPRS